jgi:ribosomal RNA-processing protein 8
LNEELYTTDSSTAYTRFSQNPELWEQYHEGFRHQVARWPVHPVQVIAKELGSNSGKVIADFGCGDAALAQSLNGCVVHSFDLVANNELVTACDMAHVPLGNASVDVAVFCLSLMGTNLADFIREAHRVLRDDGILKIAEVRSRFERDGNLDSFLKTLDKLGFECVRKDQSNKMFVLLDFCKNGKQPDKNLSYTARPCTYKRR